VQQATSASEKCRNLDSLNHLARFKKQHKSCFVTTGPPTYLAEAPACLALAAQLLQFRPKLSTPAFKERSEVTVRRSTTG
jgi:hypothetical protein